MTYTSFQHRGDAFHRAPLLLRVPFRSPAHATQVDSVSWRRGLESGPAILMSIRTDRTKGNRGAFEAARLKILKTQTICGICGKPVDFSYKNPHPLAPTVDHIIPVSKGGHPTDLSNLQLAHRCCNRAKSDSLIEPRKADESDKLIDNGMLEQHCDWARYRANMAG